MVVEDKNLRWQRSLRYVGCQKLQSTKVRPEVYSNGFQFLFKSALKFPIFPKIYPNFSDIDSLKVPPPRPET